MATNVNQNQAQLQQFMQQYQAQQAAAALRKQDLDFMRSLEQIAYCPVTGGSGATATYTVGTTLYFDLPIVPSGFAKGLLIKYNFTSVKPATGSSATYAVNQAAPWNIFSEIQVQYNGTQARLHPYFLKILDQTKGFGRGERNRIIAGNNDATIAANIVGTTPIVVNTDNLWQGQMYLPLNAISEDSVAGILPASGAGTHAQLKLTTPANFMGADPLQYPVATTGGTSASVAAVGTISVDMVYLNGMTLDGPTLLPPPPSVYGPTGQYYWEPAGTPLNAGSISRFVVQNKMQHMFMASIIIDGVQSSTFSTHSNISNFELTGDPTGSQKLKSWNVSNNISIYDYYDRDIRRMIGQDLDPGVILWVAGPIRGVVDADNRLGNLPLNMYPGGFPTATHSYTVTSTSSTNFTPRIETFLYSLNHQGLGLQQVG
jgi:hypothetical protein